MELIKGAEAFGLAIYLKDENTLAISDTHIGFEESLNRQGILVPRISYEDITRRIKIIIRDIKKSYKLKKLSKIVINGDVKDEFGRISDTEWRQLLRLFDFMAGEAKEIVLIKGNHDPALGPVASKRGIRVENELVLGRFLFLHGDAEPKQSDAYNKAETIIIGHQHPAISLEMGGRSETFKCFLVGNYSLSNKKGRHKAKAKSLIVMPSFNTLTEGTNVLREKISGKFLKNLPEFKAYVIGDEILDFGKIKDLMKTSDN